MESAQPLRFFGAFKPFHVQMFRAALCGPDAQGSYTGLTPVMFGAAGST